MLHLSFICIIFLIKIRLTNTCGVDPTSIREKIQIIVQIADKNNIFVNLNLENSWVCYASKFLTLTKLELRDKPPLSAVYLTYKIYKGELLERENLFF